MKQRIRHLFSIILALSLLATLAAPALAQERASDRFAATSVEAIAIGGGQVVFEFDITATGYMDQVGFKQIKIYEQQASGSYQCVLELDENDHGFMFTDDYCANGSYTYQGTPGVKYYARIQCYCKSDGVGESIFRNTNVETA